MERRIYDRTLFIIVTAIIFIGLIVYFTVAHPLYIFDTDDWVYTYYSRDALPIWGKWNPTKVLPETMMPLISLIGSHVFYPFCHDYIQSLGIAYSLFFSGLIVSYLCAVVILCKKLFGLSFAECSFLVFFMLLLHYLPYKVSLTRQNLFFGGNVTCHFNYLLPALLNFIVVTFYTEGKRERSNIRIGLLILATYLCINSNLWHSIVIASYMGEDFWHHLLRNAKQKAFP